MSDVWRVPRHRCVGACGVLLAVVWIGPGCATRMALEDAPIRVKNQKLEAELLTADPADVWDLVGTEFTPKMSGHARSDFKVYASKYSGALCPGTQPYKATSMTIEYGPMTGPPTKTVKIRVNAKKFRVDFPGGKPGTKVLEYAGTESDYLRSIEVHYTGPPIRCTALKPSENMVVTLH